MARHTPRHEFPETGAARHFSTNARQIPATILNSEARDVQMIAADGAEVLQLVTGVALSVEFSPDGMSLLVATGSGSALVLSLEVEELVDVAYSRLTRWWTPAECQRYLHTDVCPLKT